MVKKRKKTPLVVETKTIHKVGGSLMIALPTKFVTAHGLKAGDEIPVLSDHMIKIVPMSDGHFNNEGG